MAKKTLYFDGYCDYVLSAVAEHGKITDFNFEKKNSASVVGNIYKGRIENVLNGMNAAFINCGLARNCYLSADDVFPDANKYDGNLTEIPDALNLKEGSEIMVQVVKAPVGNKGARVTAFPAFVGKNLIYTPCASFVGVSRKIKDGELRKNLIYSAGKLKRNDEGLVFRTAAPYAKREIIELELGYLRNLYTGVSNAFRTAKIGDLLYSDLELPMRVMRDTLSYDIERIIVGSERLKKLVHELVNLYPPAYRKPVVLHDSGEDMMQEFGLTEQILEIISPRVTLENGAYLVIEKTEALTVIDVNTGKFTGGDSLEQTVYYTNILAAREIARQVKLRNIGGIVVVDFIDMTNPAHGKSLVEELERALKNDSAKCSVASMSKFGLVEFTRKRTGTSPLSLLTRPCRHCKTGYIKAPKFLAFFIRSELLKFYKNGIRTVRLDMNADLAKELNDWREFAEELKSRLPDARIYFAPHRSYPEEQINYRTGNDSFPLPQNAFALF